MDGVCEYILTAVIVELISIESTVESLDLETRRINESQPLVLRRPSEGARTAVVENKVDPVCPHGVPDGVRRHQSVILTLSVQAYRELVVEGESVPCVARPAGA